MPLPRDRSANRQSRKAGKAANKNHGPLIELAQMDNKVNRRRPKGGVTLEPKTENQRLYINEIRVKDIVFGVGPWGTGKTYVAAIEAANQFKAGNIERIVVTRPAEEAEGEKLGFLPGEIGEKYEPYFRPVKEALEESFGASHLEYLIESGQIEAMPMAFMRGATYKNCWVIADEMQNATVGQMKLLLSRIGENAKFIVNGDPNQIDLPDPSKSGLLDAVSRLKNLKQVGSVQFTPNDIVRSGLSKLIYDAYCSPERKSQSEGYIEVTNDFDETPASGLDRFLKVA